MGPWRAGRAWVCVCAVVGLADASGWVTPKASVDGLGTGSPENSSSAAERANHTDNPQPQPAPDDKVLFSAVAKLNDHLTTLHATLPTRRLSFSGDTATHARCPHSPLGVQNAK